MKIAIKPCIDKLNSRQWTQHRYLIYRRLVYADPAPYLTPPPIDVPWHRRRKAPWFAPSGEASVLVGDRTVAQNIPAARDPVMHESSFRKLSQFRGEEVLRQFRPQSNVCNLQYPYEIH